MEWKKGVEMLQLETGDKLTVEDCMYAMLLKSSNQANALAEYVAGSNEICRTL